jgi:hypothetical protein
LNNIKYIYDIFYILRIKMSSSNTKPATSTPSSGGTATAAITAAPTTSNGYRLPENTTLQHAAKLAIVEDKPIMLDYWTQSLDKTVLIGVREDNQEKLLVKSEEEYTSPISKIYKVGKEYIIITENSIYIVDVEIPSKKISA